MKRTTQFLSLLLCLLMLLPMGMTAHAAYAPKHADKADILYNLGLFKGTGFDADGKPVYALEQKANRIQGLVMLIRLLGEEADALACTDPCPFTDVPTWAQPYAAYAYAKGYTKGTSATTFGANDPLLGKAYTTFVLRALGYDDTKGDFDYNTALTLGAQLGLLSDGEYTADLYRDDCAALSCNALKTNLKSGSGTLADKLISAKVLTKDAVQASGLYNGTVDVPITYINGVLEIRTADILAAFPNGEYYNFGGWGGVTPAAFAQKDFSPIKILQGSAPVTAALGGKKNDTPTLTSMNRPTASYRNTYSGGNNMAILTVLTKDLTLVGYCVIPPQFPLAEATHLTFTTCELNGKEEISRLKNTINNVQKLDPSLLYCEKIITTLEDGTEQSEIYMHVNEKNLPASVKDFKYYCIKSGGDKNALLRYYSVGSNAKLYEYGVDTIWGNNFAKGDPSYEKDYFFFISESKDILAVIKLPDEVRMIETRK